MNIDSTGAPPEGQEELPANVGATRAREINGPAGGIDVEQAARQLGMLGVLPDAPVWFETLDDVRLPDPTGAKPQGVKREDKRLKTDCVAQLAAAAKPLGRLNAGGAGVYFAVNEIAGKRRIKANVSRIRAVFCECDDGLPKGGFPIEPTMMVETSPGKFHVYWACDGLSVEDFNRVMERMVADYGSDDGAKDITRILRLAGSWHMKNPEAPWQVRIIAETDKRYTRSEIMAAFPPIERKQRDTDKQVRALKAGTAHIGAELERIDGALRAIPPNVKYATWLTIGMALHDYFGGDETGLARWDVWSQGSANYRHEGDDHPPNKWETFGSFGGERARIGTLFRLAKEHGWKDADHLDTITEVELPKDTAHLSAIEFGTEIASSSLEWTGDRLAELLTRMNRDHAVVSVAGSVRFMHQTIGLAGQPQMEFLRSDDMANLYAAIGIPREHNGKRKIVSAFAVWRTWPHRRQYSGIGMFPPGMKAPKGYFNLWTGFAVEPREGDWKLFRAHLFNMVCGGDEAIFTWFMDWLADLVQNPAHKPGSALVLESEAKGSGKSMVIAMLKRLLGRHALSVSKSELVVGRFNGHLQDILLLGVEEAFWAGNKAATGALKSLITEAEITIERKNLNAYDAPNFTRLIFTSNERWVVPVGETERRFLVLRVKNPHANKREYFDPIFEQMEKRGGLEAMLHELLNRKIISDLRNPPETGALIDQRVQSLDGIRRWIWTVARDGEFREPGRDHPVVIDDEEETPVSTSATIAAAKAFIGRYDDGRDVDTALGKLLGRVGVVWKRIRDKGERISVYTFPPLGALRENVERELKVPCQEGQTGESLVREQRDAATARGKDQAMRSELGLTEMGVLDAKFQLERLDDRLDTIGRQLRANGYAGP